MPLPKFQLYAIFVGSSAHRFFKVCCFLFFRIKNYGKTSLKVLSLIIIVIERQLMSVENHVSYVLGIEAY
jgi:hypothetical protein